MLKYLECAKFITGCLEIAYLVMGLYIAAKMDASIVVE